MFAPGSLLQLDHPHSWYVDVREKSTGKLTTYWINGNNPTRETVAEHCARHFHAVEVLTIYPCTSPPTRILKPIPPEHYEYGIRREIEGGDEDPVTAADFAPIARVSLRGPSLRRTSVRT